MSVETQDRMACRSEEIAAYLDGELDVCALNLFEEHVANCAGCAEELKVHRRLLGELNFALSEDAFGPELPANFAQVVAARAQSDLSGVRGARERKRALRLCAILSAVAFALLGFAAVGETVFAPLRAIWRCSVAILSFLGHALYDFGAGVAVISRGFGGHLLFESRGLGLGLLLLFASALLILRRLIAGYRRAQTID